MAQTARRNTTYTTKIEEPDRKQEGHRALMCTEILRVSLISRDSLKSSLKDSSAMRSERTGTRPDT